MQIERKKKSKCKLSKSEITQLYTEGKSTSEIATLANVSARYIRMVLTDNNVPRRAIGVGRGNMTYQKIILKRGQIIWLIY